MSVYDLAIAGAGPAGSVLALLAARARYRVLLVEKSHFERPRFGETAPPELRQALTRVGLERLAQAPFCREAPEVLSVWGSDEPWSRHHIFSPYGTALHLDRRAFDEALALAARDAGADLKLGCAARFAAQPRGGYIVQLSTGESIRANAAILATGRVGGASAFRMCVNTWTTTSRSLRVSRCPRGISTRGR
jgi:flavin-dependent dehydrogenase